VKLRAAAIIAALTAASIADAGAQALQAIDTFEAAWARVRDTHFDRSFNGVDWDAVRAELRPKAAAVRTAAELRGVLHDMLGRLGQSHFQVIPATTDTGGGARSGAGGDPGFDVRLVDGELLVTRVEAGGGAATAGVRPGWRLTHIGIESVADMLRALPERLDARLRHVEAWRAAVTRLRGPLGTRVHASFDDAADRPLAMSIERRPEAGQPVTVGNLPTMFVRAAWEPQRTPGGATAGVIAFNVWMVAVDAQFQQAMDELRTSDGIVIDLRGNPGGLAGMLMGISGHFIGERKPLGIMKTRDNELRFVANPRLVTARGERVTPYAGPVAILIDAMSGSASECFAGGMQSIGRARVFGQTSMGQALPALFYKLPNGDVLIHANGDFVTAGGTRLEGRGVIPDEIVPLRRQDLLAGTDRTLQAALNWIDGREGKSEPQHP
jgi:carboxyl-terminal processing protease